MGATWATTCKSAISTSPAAWLSSAETCEAPVSHVGGNGASSTRAASDGTCIVVESCTVGKSATSVVVEARSRRDLRRWDGTGGATVLTTAGVMETCTAFNAAYSLEVKEAGGKRVWVSMMTTSMDSEQPMCLDLVSLPKTDQYRECAAWSGGSTGYPRAHFLLSSLLRPMQYPLN
jgi:hypothetical protein